MFYFKLFLIYKFYINFLNSYLAHEMVEDWKLLRNCIVPWFPVSDHQSNFSELNRIKNIIWAKMNYECFINKELCDNVSNNTNIKLKIFYI